MSTQCLACPKQATAQEKGTNRPFCSNDCQRFLRDLHTLGRSIFDEGFEVNFDTFLKFVEKSDAFGFAGLATVLNETDTNDRLVTMLQWLFELKPVVFVKVWKVACMQGYTRLVKFMIREMQGVKAEIEARNANALDPRTPKRPPPVDKYMWQGLDWAAEGTGSADVVRKLLKHGADPRYSDDYNSIIGEAAGKGHIEMVRLLLKDGRDDPRNFHNQALRRAARNGHTEIVRLLLQDGRSDPTDQYDDWQGDVCYLNHVEVLRLLLKDSRFNPARHLNGPGALLSLACLENNNVEIVRLLLKDGRSDPTSGASYCLLEACRNDFVDIARLLLEDGRANPNAHYGKYLYDAAVGGRVAIVRLLLEDGRANPTNLAIFERTVREGEDDARVEIIRLLLDDMNTQLMTPDFVTAVTRAFFYACDNGQLKMMRVFLDSSFFVTVVLGQGTDFLATALTLSPFNINVAKMILKFIKTRGRLADFESVLREIRDNEEEPFEPRQKLFTKYIAKIQTGSPKRLKNQLVF